jgi:hypothetical protein
MKIFQPLIFILFNSIVACSHIWFEELYPLIYESQEIYIQQMNFPNIQGESESITLKFQEAVEKIFIRHSPIEMIQAFNSLICYSELAFFLQFWILYRNDEIISFKQFIWISSDDYEYALVTLLSFIKEKMFTMNEKDRDPFVDTSLKLFSKVKKCIQNHSTVLLRWNKSLNSFQKVKYRDIMPTKFLMIFIVLSSMNIPRSLPNLMHQKSKSDFSF